jgi:4-amino-4-deoxy-L-arabinose transferase-like glycosyltransferase
MAALRRPFGFDAVFLVVPILTAATVWLTYVLGRQVHGAAAGCVAACWLATTPAFTMAAVTPMSDVPAAAFWTAALAACGGSGRWRGALAGGAAAMAILVRPNLAPLAAMIALPFAVRAWRQHTRPALAGLLACLAAAGSGVVFVGLLFNFWYGSPFASGYGSFDYLFSLANIGPNLRRYPVWLMSTATALSAAAVLAPVLLTRARMPGARRAWWLLGFCGLVWCAYLPYIPFGSWDFLRFLLPAYPAQFVLASTVLVDLTRRTLAPRGFTMVLTALLVLYGANYHNGLLHNDLRTLEARYRRVGEFVRRELPLRAVLLGMQHSGSLRLYGGRETLRSDYLPPLRLEAAIRHLDTRGWRVYFVLDDWEEEGFRDRFGPHSPLGRLDWTPLAIVPGPMPVRIYDPKDRARGSVGEAHAESPKPGAESPTEPSRR